MKKLLFYTFFFLISILNYAQNGENDATFNSDDIGFGSGIGFDSYVNTIVLQNDEKILVGGGFSSYNATSRSTIGRLNSDGTLDTTFDVGSGFNSPVNSLVVQSDGKIIAAGGFTSFNSSQFANGGIIRLNPDGTIDFSFDTGSGVGMGGFINSVAIQSDGKILAGGSFSDYNGFPASNIVRINTDGTFDSTFDAGTGFDGEVKSVVVQSTGEIVVGGSFTSFNGTTRNRITRLNADGTLDTSFEPGSGLDNSVSSLTIQSDDKILTGGSFSSYNGTSINHFARINSDGTLDASFNSGTSFNNVVSSVTVQSDGKILAGGQFSSYNGTSLNKIARINPDGTIDNSFNIGTGLDNEIYTFAFQNDDKILLGGNFDTYNDTARHKITRLHVDGANDFQFNPPTGFNNHVLSLSVQDDEKIIAGGRFTKFKETTRNRIIRLDSEGELDATFDPGTGFNDQVNSVLVQDDGKILVGGEFTVFNGTQRNNIARLNIDGSLDTSFDPGTGFNNDVNTIAVQSDGKIVVGGAFTSFNGATRNRILRLNTDGTLDTSFDPGTGFDESISFVNSIVIQNNDKIIVGGWFTSFNGTTQNRIVRLNTDGTLDATFNPGTGFNERVTSMAILDDEKIIVVGWFTSFNGITQNRIIRLNPDGTRDTSFNSNAGFNNGAVFSLEIQSDGKIITGGDFNSYDGTSMLGLARLHVDGSLDNSFEIGTGFDRGVHALAVQSDNKIITGGAFTSYNGIGRNMVARLHGGCTDVSVSTQWSTITANNADATYQWINCNDSNSPIPDEVSQSFTATQDGDYAVIVSSNINSCVDTSDCINITSAYLEEPFTEKNLRLYPNPNNGSFTIEANKPLKTEVFNSIGRKIDVKFLEAGKNQFNLGNTENGIYYIYTTDNLGNRSSQKIIIMN